MHRQSHWPSDDLHEGAFGGGFAIIGIPLLALAMVPISAGALLAPTFIASVIVASRYWRASTWSKPDLVGNLLKAGPWLALATPSRELWILMGLCFLTTPLGVWSGWHLHERLNERQLYTTCYALLVVVAAKLLWDGLTGYF